ncbi:hypothetical protein DFQ29_007458 [Apophysomyces sp. BC1021]|nr:hypothetical protein DFQ29_007458 [Apophysomyces sp. BC1021]
METPEQLKAAAKKKISILSKACDNTLAKLGGRSLSTYNKAPVYVTFQQPTEVLQNTVLHYLTFDRRHPWGQVTGNPVVDIKTNTVQNHVAPFVDYKVEITRDRSVYPPSRGLKLRPIDDILKDEPFLRGDKRASSSTQSPVPVRRPETAPVQEEQSAVQKALAQIMTSHREREQNKARERAAQQKAGAPKRVIPQQKSLPETQRKTPQAQPIAKKITKKTSSETNLFKKPAPVNTQRAQTGSSRAPSNTVASTSKLSSAQTKSAPNSSQRISSSSSRVTSNTTAPNSKGQSTQTKSTSQARKKSKRSLKISEHPVRISEERLGQDRASDPLLSRTITKLRERFGKKKKIRERPVLRLHISLSPVRAVKRSADEELCNSKAQQRPRIDTQSEEARPRRAGKKPTVYTEDPRSKFNIPTAAIPAKITRLPKIPKRSKSVTTTEKGSPAPQSQPEVELDKPRTASHSEPVKRSPATQAQSKYNDVELEEGETISGDEREDDNRHTSRREDDNHRHTSRRDSRRYSEDKAVERQQKRREEREEDSRRHTSRRDSRRYSDDKPSERQQKRREEREEDSRRHTSRRESRHHSDDKTSERQPKRRESDRHDDEKSHDERRRKRSRHREDERQDKGRSSSASVLNADERQDDSRVSTTSLNPAAPNINRRHEENRAPASHTTPTALNTGRRHNDKRASTTTYPDPPASNADKRHSEDHVSTTYPNSTAQNTDKQPSESRAPTTNSNHTTSNADKKTNEGRASTKSSNHTTSQVDKQPGETEASTVKPESTPLDTDETSTSTTYPNPTAPNAESNEQLRVFSFMFLNLATAHKRRGDQADSEIKCILDHFHAFLNYILTFYFRDRLGQDNNQKNWETLHPFCDVLLNKLRVRKEMELYGLCLRMKALVHFHTFSRREVHVRQKISTLHGKDKSADKQKVEDYSKDADRTFNEHEQAYGALRESEKYLSFLDIQTKFPESFRRVCIQGEPGPGIVLGGEAGTTVGPMFPLTPYSRLHHACIMAKCILSEYTTVQKLNYHYITNTDDFM